MPLKVAAEDRKLMILVGTLLLVSSIIIIYLAISGNESNAIPSSYGTGNSGTKAAFLLLQEMGYKPQRWSMSPDKIAEAGANTTLILAEPEATSQADIDAIRRFMNNGGRVIATGESFAILAGGNYMRPGQPHFQWKPYAAQAPSRLTRGVREIYLAPRNYFNHNDATESPFEDDGEFPVIRVQYDKGEFIWVSTSEPFSNAGLRQGDNAQFLLNCIGPPGERQVLWDEYFHQGSKTFVDTMLQSPLKWGMVQAALIGLLAVFTWGRRFGVVRQSVTEPRLAPLEFAQTLAGLYKKSKAANVAVEIVHERFRHLLQRKYSILTAEGHATAAQHIADHLPASNAEDVRLLLSQVEQAISTPALDMGQAQYLIAEIHELGARLKLYSR